MNWTQDAIAALEALEGVHTARIGEASDGRPGRGVFRVYIELDEATPATPELFASVLDRITGAADAGLAGGSVECAVRTETALRQVSPRELLGGSAERGLRVAGGAVHVTADWLRRRKERS